MIPSATGNGVVVGINSTGALGGCGGDCVALTGAPNFAITAESLVGDVARVTESFFSNVISLVEAVAFGWDVPAVGSAAVCCLLEARGGKATVALCNLRFEGILLAILVCWSACGVDWTVLVFVSTFWPNTDDGEIVAFG